MKTIVEFGAGVGRLRQRPARQALRLAAAALALAVSGPLLAAQNLALLVGVVNANATGHGVLQGPPNDVEAMQRVLTQRWGFSAGEVKTLKKSEATKAAILQELDSMIQRAKPGDNVVFYYSGHGISALDANFSKVMSLPQSSGALVPSDAVVAGGITLPEKLIVGRDDLRPRFDRLDAIGARVIVIVDACYSGQVVRSVNRPDQGVASLPKRYLAQPYQGNNKVGDMYQAQSKPSVVEPYPYKNVVLLSSAAEGETALDINSDSLFITPTLFKVAHGAMTDALLRVLTNDLSADSDSNGTLTYHELKTAVAGFMADRGYGHSPQLLPPVAEDTQGLATRSVFGSGKFATGEALKKPSFTVSKLKVSAPNIQDGNVLKAIAGVPGVDSVGRQLGDIRVSEDSPGIYLVKTQSDDTIVKTAKLSELTAVLAGYSAAHQLLGVAQRHQRGGLQLDVNPAAFGGNFFFGQKVNFVVRPDRAATLVILNLDANGKWTTLYPGAKYEQAPIAALKARFIPGESPSQMIDVTPPEGMDSVFAFAFDEPPAGLDAITGIVTVDLQDPRMERFISGLSKMDKRFTFSKVELRAFPLPKKP